MGVCMVNAFCVGVAFSTGCYGLLLTYLFFGWRPRTLIRHSLARNSEMDVAVVIAARNEEAGLRKCLESLLVQSGLAQVIVVDDHSGDSTRAIAESFAARDQRVTCLSAPPLPEGWIGKTHALHFGAQRVKNPHVLFTDADVVFGPGILADAMRLMQKERLDHLGGHFFVDCQTMAEEICAPVLVLSSALALFGTADSKGASTGAFNLVRTVVYEACGGHAPIKGEVVDDVALARLLKAAGARSRFVAMGDRVKVRLFVGFRGFVDVVSRSAVPFLRWGRCAVGAATVLCMLLAVMPILLLIGLVCHLAGPHAYCSATWCLAPLPLLLGIVSIHFSRPFHNGRFFFQVFFPAAMFVLGASVFHASLTQMRRRQVTWRGRVYATS
jgi:hypothetical protein